MQKLFERNGHDVTSRALRFLSICLSGRPETATLATEVHTARTTLAEKQEAFENAKETRVAATAQIRYHDDRLDDRVKAVALKVLVEVGGDRTSARYRSIFPVAPSTGTGPTGGPSQARFVRSVADALEQDEALAGEAPALREGLAALEAAEARREDLYVPEARARAELEVALDAARRIYNTMHARLTLLFPDDPALVESHFATLHRRHSTATDEEDEG